MTAARAFYKLTKGKNSPYNIILTDADAILDSTGVTRCDLNFIKDGVAGAVISSDVNPSWFNLQYSLSYEGVATNAIRIDLKDATINPGRYEVEIFVWDAVSTSGRFAGTINTQVDGPLSTPMGALPMDLFGNIRVPSDTPATITADQDDYSPGSNAHVRLASDASRTITGLAYIADGQLRKISNVGANNIVLAHESTSSVAANRFILSRQADTTVYPGDTIELIYDGESNRWRQHPPSDPHFRRTAAEITAGAVPKNTLWRPGDIRRYGAVVDGSTDDSAAWQAAMNQCVSGGPPVIWEGNSAINSQLTYNDDLSIRGSGDGLSRITWTGAATAVFARPAAGQYDHVEFSGFEAVDTGSGSALIDLQSTIYASLRDITIDGFATGINGIDPLYTRFDNILVRNATDGFLLSAGGNNLFINCIVETLTGNGWRLEDAGDNTLLNCHTISSVAGGILISDGSDRNKIIGVDLTGVTGTEVNIGATADKTMLIGNRYTLGAPTVTDNGSDTVIIGNDGLLRTTKAVTNTNTPSGATAEAFPIYDNAGTLRGYIPVYAAQW